MLSAELKPYEMLVSGRRRILLPGTDARSGARTEKCAATIQVTILDSILACIVGMPQGVVRNKLGLAGSGMSAVFP